MKETSGPAQLLMLRPTTSEVVKRRSVRTNANVLNRRSWPLAPGSFRQQLR
ncbi:pleckstriny domain-containing family G member 5-like isoform X4, partial [Biomphalaria glabrata]